jgi:hypothetical protein
VFRRSFFRWPYLFAVAIVAATVSDLLVEAVANTGVFGGAYFDTDDSSIIPSLIVAAALGVGIIGRCMRAACRRSSAHRRDWFAAVARDVARHAPLRDVRYVLGAQFAALFVMESAEQLLARGHLAGGLLWLGGPPLVAIAAHVGVGIACTLAAGWLMRVSIPRFASLVSCALAFVLAARRIENRTAFIVRRDAASCDHGTDPCLRRISGRAPPFLPQPAQRT